MNYLAKKDDRETALERANRGIALQAALEGAVLLENDGALPFSEGTRRLALFGSGARKTVKGGTGSGDVNERSCVNVEEGLEREGFRIVTKGWLDAYDRLWEQDRRRWKAQLAEIAARRGVAFVYAYLETPHLLPVLEVAEEDLPEADAAVYVVARRSGEGCDRMVQGDYELSGTEKAGLLRLRRRYEKLAVVLNTGGPVDTAWLKGELHPSALLVLSQAGMEGGTALARLLSGRNTPCGKLTDTWALQYGDYPEAEHFSAFSANPGEVYYREGIYVGYRYFETAGKQVSYPFGYGGSYTSFSISYLGCELEGGVHIRAVVKNTGTYPGKEVVQVYCRAPEGRLDKPSRVLAGFAKTGLLAPGEEQELTVRCPLEAFSSYDEAASREILEAGDYMFYLGNSVADASAALRLFLPAELCLHQYERALAPVRGLEEWSVTRREEGADPPVETRILSGEEACQLYDSWLEKNMPGKGYILPEKIRELLSAQPAEKLIRLTVGAAPEDRRSEVGNASVNVPGAAGQTSDAIGGIPELVLADGGSGLRLLHHFQTDAEGRVLEPDSMAGLERGAFAGSASESASPVAAGSASESAGPAAAGSAAYPGTFEDYYQYCTAFPIGTMLAQTWNEELLWQVGEAVGREMQEFGVHLWLAPSINIHRNPLCGRNFEYYSEDPLLTGRLAAAVCRGVQGQKGAAATVKHFAANNQELARLKSNSIVSERALREIYLKAFEIVVKTAHPLALMTSYNKLNGIQTANRWDLCTQIARREWGFDGLIMTDWGTTDYDSDPVLCIRCGNDLLMPGGIADRKRLEEAWRAGRLERRELEEAAAHIAGVALRLRG